MIRYDLITVLYDNMYYVPAGVMFYSLIYKYEPS